MNITKDVYEYLTNFADDRTILNMLSVNKKFNDEKFFERVIQRKYPLLIRFKKENDTWRSFYIRMIYYIAKLQQEFDFPYIPNTNPERFYLDFSNSTLSKEDMMDIGLDFSALSGIINLIDYFIEKGATNLDNALYITAEKGHLEAVKYLVNRGAKRIDMATRAAAEKGHLEIVKYLFDKDPNNLTNISAVLDAAENNHKEIVEYFLEKGVDAKIQPFWNESIADPEKYSPEIYALLLKF